ncbi:MAG: PepSY domain-containing protein [Cellulosilyticaceae bacterium]
MKKVFQIMLLSASIMLVACGGPTPADGTPVSPTPENNQATNEITIEKAKEIALQHADVTAEQVSFVRAERDFDNGVEKYDIEFYMGDKEYDYEIHAETGEIIGYDHDVEDDNASDIKPETSAANFTEEEAKAIALKHANVTADQVTFAHTEYEVDNGIEKYDLEFYINNVEYNYEINANTGDIIGFEKD